MTTIEDQARARLVAALEHLKVPFDRKQIGKIPASAGRPALDFVGHAVVTARLNQYAPDWTYSVDESFQHGGQFWVRGTMTIEGVSRVEYGQGKNPLEAISHFIRRAAMRFGVATDLWSREELEDVAPTASRPNRPSRSQEPDVESKMAEIAVAVGAATSTSGEGEAHTDVEADGSAITSGEPDESRHPSPGVAPSKCDHPALYRITVNPHTSRPLPAGFFWCEQCDSRQKESA